MHGESVKLKAGMFQSIPVRNFLAPSCWQSLFWWEWMLSNKRWSTTKFGPPPSLGLTRRANTSHRKSLSCYWLREM